MKTGKLKILETIRQGKVGGGETHVLELCTHLDKEKYEPVVLSFTNGPMVEELRRRGIRTHVIYTETAFDFRVWKKVGQFMRKEQFDVVHAHGSRAMSNVFWAAKRLHIPILYTVHGWSFHPDQKPLLRKLRELSEKMLTQQANRTLCVSRSNQKDGIERFNMPRSQVIYNAVDFNKFDVFSENYKNVRAELNIPEEATLYGFIARITQQKDPLTMIRIFKKLSEKTSDAMLLMVGDGELKPDVKKLVQELSLTEQVIFQPFRSDIPDVLKATDVYCLPSLWEGFPIGILEAMAMKTAIVASPVDGNKELVNDGKSGLLIDQSNIEKWADALFLLHTDTGLREILAKNGHEFVRSQFGVNRLVSEVGEVYQQLKANTSVNFDTVFLNTSVQGIPFQI